MSDEASAAGESPAASEMAYFHAIEERFIALRGAPLLLSSKDWKIAQEWRDREIPLDVVLQAITELFERRAERGSKRNVSSLSYCRRAVEAAWEELVELTQGAASAGTSLPQGADELDVAARLRTLSQALPATLAERTDWRDRLLGLEGSAEVVEGELIRLDQALLAACEDVLSAAEARAVDTAVAQQASGLEARLSDGERRGVLERLRREEVRRRTGMPVLSLFAVEGDA